MYFLYYILYIKSYYIYYILDNQAHTFAKNNAITINHQHFMISIGKTV